MGYDDWYDESEELGGIGEWIITIIIIILLSPLSLYVWVERQIEKLRGK